MTCREFDNVTKREKRKMGQCQKKKKKFDRKKQKKNKKSLKTITKRVNPQRKIKLNSVESRARSILSLMTLSYKLAKLREQ